MTLQEVPTETLENILPKFNVFRATTGARFAKYDDGDAELDSVSASRFEIEAELKRRKNPVVA